ncbi:MAG: PIG-L family deacetylase [Sphingobacteriales bacterium]|nr:MAG: PIG-L family deacetylase [Sphingobacteriales bacterium]
MKKLLLITSFLLTGSLSYAQQVRPASSARIYHEISQLKHLTNVLYFAAHPDDENTRLLAYLVNDKHLRTAYLSLTRGDGGQNIIGSEQGAALGLIRTHELLEARKLDGAEQFFTRAIDFGFSKNYTETFKHWNDDQLTADAVWVIRKYRPDVIICRFPPNEMAGHGQHAASAIIAEKAFKAAGNASQYSDQLSTYAVWQPKRILQNTYRFGDRNTTAEDQFKIPVGQYEPLLGMGVGELAGISRSIHKSQGAGTPSTPGIQTEYFKTVGGDEPKKSLFDGIDITWGRVGRKEIGDEIKDILKDYDFKHPEESLPALIALRKQIETVKDEYWRTEKLEELDNVIVHCAGIMAELYTQQQESVAGNTLPFTLKIVARAETPVKITGIKWLTKDTTTNIVLSDDSLITLQTNITVPSNTLPTEPYWLKDAPQDAGHYTISNKDDKGYPEAPNYLNAIITLKIGDNTMSLRVPLSYKKLDPTRGDVVEALRIVPNVTLSFTSNLLIPEVDGSLNTSVHIHSFANISNATLNIAGSNLSKSIGGVKLSKDQDTLINIKFTSAEMKATGPNDIELNVSLTADGKTYNKTQHLIQYEHIPTLQYFTPAKAKVLHNNWKVTAKRIGYIEGAGDNVVSVLRQAGLQVDVLKDADINEEKLKKYDAILTGIRAVNVEKKMEYWMPTLLKYVKNGGTLVMQYNTLQDLSTKNIGPYPFTLSSLRVTEEDAKIAVTNPTSKLMTYPNKIDESDFSGWVQERGLYYPNKWDDHYQTLYKMNDTGEEVLSSATLYTPYGKGNYVYTSLSFFRQLPAGNKGAIRLLMNMLSVGK